MARKSCFELLRDISNYIFASRDTPPGDKLHVSRFQATCICIVDILLGSEISHYWWVILVTHFNFKVLTCIKHEGFESLKILKKLNFFEIFKIEVRLMSWSGPRVLMDIHVKFKFEFENWKNPQIIKNFDHSIKTWRFSKFKNLGISKMNLSSTKNNPEWQISGRNSHFCYKNGIFHRI